MSARADTAMPREYGTGTGGELYCATTTSTSPCPSLALTVRERPTFWGGVRVGPAVEEGTDTDRKVGTQRDRGKREEKQRVCTQLHATSGD